jgi:aspartate kinase
MLIYKFGGSSVKNAEGIKNISAIIHNQKNRLVVVVSALGCTTNALEELVKRTWDKKPGFERAFEKIKKFHFDLLKELVGKKRPEVERKLVSYFHELEFLLKGKPGNDFDRYYDQIVSHGELWSTTIIHAYLEGLGVHSEWMDVREMILTDDHFRSARVQWEKTEEAVKKRLSFSDTAIYITQGFIGRTKNNLSVTLGREGSDFTAAIPGNVLEAEKVVIWKDVQGVLNADPKAMTDPVLLPEITYQEAIELAYFGARVIHPKTIKPLQNKKIPLLVKSFYRPQEGGTSIKEGNKRVGEVPSFIFKEKQLLISISPRDFSFVIEQSLGNIFTLLNKHKVKINLIQNSAISISICVDENDRKLPGLLADLKNNYKTYYNKEVRLITVRHYTEDAILQVMTGDEILIEQKTRSTVHFVVRDR